MDSKQFNFYTTPRDIEGIAKFLKSRYAIILVDQYIGTNKSTLNSLSDVDTGIFQLYITTQHFHENVSILTTKQKKIKYFDKTSSPILQYNLGGFFPYDLSSLQRARFYYIRSYFDENQQLAYKSNDFINWCDSLINDFKDTFLKKYDKEKAFLYSESAISWIEENDADLINLGQQWKAGSPSLLN